MKKSPAVAAVALLAAVLAARLTERDSDLSMVCGRGNVTPWKDPP